MVLGDIGSGNAARLPTIGGFDLERLILLVSWDIYGGITGHFVTAETENV